MRIILLAALLLPLVSFTQVNRSAIILASENIGYYLTNKVFQGQPYSPLTYGDLKPCKDRRKDIYWQLDHRFEITETRVENDRTVPVRKTYHFYFYLDDKMKVKRAEAYYNSN